MAENQSIFTKPLIKWYLENKRDLPWRNTKDPYLIWLSEIILQQTRVAQGLPYYNNFVKTFPTVFNLAKASEQEVLKLWQGLGYYSRARNLHYTAKEIVSKYNGVFPDNYKQIIALKGIGDYTASAIASIAFKENCAVVDGNVYRVLARFYGINLPINSTTGIKKFKNLAQTLIDTSQPDVFNQAIMEFGAIQCAPKNPSCSNCIFNTKCYALQKNEIDNLPVKLKKGKVKTHYFNFLVPISKNNKTILQQRKLKGIWQNLYEFPLIETSKKATKSKIIEHPVYKQILSYCTVNHLTLFNDKPINHKLTHKNLHISFWILNTSPLQTIGTPIKNIKSYPVPIVIANFISQFNQLQH